VTTTDTTLQLAGNLARLPAKALNTAAGIYLGTRLAYNLLYINATTRKLPKYTPCRARLLTMSFLAALGYARSGAWWTGTISLLSLFVQAGNNMYDGPRITY